MNPLTNGKIVATNYDSRLYVKQADGIKRGHPGYVMSRSQLVEFATCPSRWVRGYGENDEGTDSTEWGSLVDCLLFEPSRFDERFAIEPISYEAVTEATKTKPSTTAVKPWNNNATACKEWKAQQGDRIIIKRRDLIEAEVAIRRLKEDEIVSPIFSSSDFQVYVTAEYHDSKTGIVVPVKALIDLVPQSSGHCRALIDYKTARDASPSNWDRVVFDRGYHVQAALFLDAYNAATNEGRDTFRHIAQENFAPYEVSRPEIEPGFLSAGRAVYLEALKLYAECLSTGHWHGYDDLSRTNVNGWSIVSPKAHMVEISDPDWISEPEEKEAA